MADNLQINKLRSGQNEDYWAVVEIMQNTLGSKCPKVHNLYPQLENVPKTYAARIENRIVGGLIWRYYHNLEAMQIELLAVDTEFSRRGVGSRLVAAFEDYAKECILKQAEIRKLMLDANHTNYIFFEKLGWGFAEGKPAEGFWGPVEMIKMF